MADDLAVSFRLGGRELRRTPYAARGGALLFNVPDGCGLRQVCVTAENAVDVAEFWRVLSRFVGGIVDEDGDAFPG